MDALSDVIASVRFTSSAFLDARLSAPWCIEAQITPEDCAPFGSIPARVIAYHFVVSGELCCCVGDQAPVRLGAGDILLLPRNDRHVLASAPGLRAAAIDQLIKPADGGRPAQLAMGGGGQVCHLICGFLGSDLPHNPLFDALPALLRLQVGNGTADHWLAGSFQHAAQEFAVGGVGSATVLGKLAELLFVEALRRYLTALPETHAGWLAGLRDPKVGKALALMHRELARAWTVAELASAADLSRSAFAERFTQLVGMPPLRYLGQWRLQLAAMRLRESPRSIGQIAYEVGYSSETAFNRAFRKAFNCSPGQWRNVT